MLAIPHLGSFTKANRDAINQNFLTMGLGTAGNVLYLDPANGNDSAAVVNDSTKPWKTLLAAYTSATAGQNDTIVLVSNGATSSTARVDAAFTWAKAATHLMGMCAPSMSSQRARIAPTAATTAFANFFTISASGCLFSNLEFFHGFTTGAAAMICLTITGHYNSFQNCHIAGMGDTASANSTTSRSLLVKGSENYFGHCTVGISTKARTAANASLEFAVNPTTGYGAAENVFEDCIFPFSGTSTGMLAVKVAAGAIDRFNYFRRVVFANSGALSGGVTMAALVTAAALPGGGLLFDNCSRYLITAWGTDSDSLAACYVCGPGVVGTNTGTCGLGAVAV